MPQVKHKLEQATGADKKRPYQTARLKVYGAVRHLTMSGTAGEAEAGNPMGQGQMDKRS